MELILIQVSSEFIGNYDTTLQSFLLIRSLAAKKTRQKIFCLGLLTIILFYPNVYPSNTFKPSSFNTCSTTEGLSGLLVNTSLQEIIMLSPAICAN